MLRARGEIPSLARWAILERSTPLLLLDTLSMKNTRRTLVLDEDRRTPDRDLSGFPPDLIVRNPIPANGLLQLLGEVVGAP